MKVVYIYVLKDPITDSVRYVGQSSNPARRFNAHVSRSSETNHRTNWIRAMRATGLKPILEIIDEVPESEWQQWEIAYIEYFRECGCDLVNSTVGGDGTQCPSLETRAKMSAAKRGEKNLNFGKDLSGVNGLNFGNTCSASTRAKIGAANSGKKHGMFGKTHTPEAREKIRIAGLGRKFSLETIAKMSASAKSRGVGKTFNT